MSQITLRELKLNSAVKYVAREGFVNEFPITFDYDNPTQLQVFVGFKRVGEWDLQVLNGLPSVVLPEDLKVGQGITIRRASPAEGVPHTYQYKGNAQGGAEFSAKTIDENFEYMSNLVSEVEDYNTIAQDNLSDMEEKFDVTQDIANEAIRVADEAKDTADNAEQVALGIDGKAQEALDNSVEALGVANDAKSIAQGIDSKAQEALDQSTTASQDASNALSIAQGIDGKAQTALDNSTEALGTANTALTVAQGVEDKAQEALDTAQSALDSIPTDYVKDSDFNALITIVDNKRDLDDNVFNGLMTIKSDNNEQGSGILLQDVEGTVRGQVVATDQGLQLTQYPEGGGSQTFTFPKYGEGGELLIDSKQTYVTPQMYGAKGDGVTDDSTAFIKMFEDNTHVRIPLGTYKLNSGITLPYDAVLEGYGAILDFSECNDRPYINTKDVELIPLPKLAGNVSEGDRTLHFSEPHGLEYNDLVVIYDPVDGSWDTSRVYYRKGERFLVATVDSDTSITIQGNLFDSYEDHVELYKHAVKTSTHISGITVIGHPDSSKALDGIWYNKDFKGSIRDVHVYNVSYTCISLRQSFGTKVDNCFTTEDMGDTAGGEYGIVIGNSQYIVVDSCYVASRRHGMAFGGSSGVGCVVNYGNLVVNSTISTQGHDEAADMHTNTAFSAYRGCNIIGAVSYGGRGNVVDGCIITEPVEGVLNDNIAMLQCYPYADISFTNNKIRLSKTRTNRNVNPIIFCYYLQDTREGGIVNISGNTIEDSSEYDNDISQYSVIGTSNVVLPDNVTEGSIINIHQNTYINLTDTYKGHFVILRVSSNSKMPTCYIKNNNVVGKCERSVYLYCRGERSGDIYISNNNFGTTYYQHILVDNIDKLTVVGNTFNDCMLGKTSSSNTNCVSYFSGVNKLYLDGNVLKHGGINNLSYNISGYDIVELHRGKIQNIPDLRNRFNMLGKTLELWDAGGDNDIIIGGDSE